MRTSTPRTPLLAFTIALLASLALVWLILDYANRVPLTWPQPAGYQQR